MSGLPKYNYPSLSSCDCNQGILQTSLKTPITSTRHHCMCVTEAKWQMSEHKDTIWHVISVLTLFLVLVAFFYIRMWLLLYWDQINMFTLPYSEVHRQRIYLYYLIKWLIDAVATKVFFSVVSHNLWGNTMNKVVSTHRVYQPSLVWCCGWLVWHRAHHQYWQTTDK